MNAAAIYARISADRTGRHAGVQRQIQECQEWATRHGHVVAEIYEDNDLSAYRGKLRPGYRRMCDDIKAGTRDGVIIWHLDRLHRHPVEQEQFIILIEATGAAVHTVTGGDYDLSTTDGRAMARVVGAFARKESEDKSRRIKSQQRQHAYGGGRIGGGTRAFGYTADHKKTIAAEARIVREAATRILAGETLRSVCADLTARGVPTVTGTEWTTTVLKRILTSARISAQIEYKGEIVAIADWPQIVTHGETTRLRAILNDPSRRTNRTPRSYPLTGLVYCGRCGAKMVARPRGDGRRRYFCAKGPGFSGCGGTAVLAEPLEVLIAEAVLHALDTPNLQRALLKEAADDDEAEVLQREIDDSNAELDALASLWGQRRISMSQWNAARIPIEERIEQAARRMGRLTRSTALQGFVGNSDALRGQWADLPAPRQRAIVAALLNRITVQPAVRGRNRFDETRIAPEWRV